MFFLENPRLFFCDQLIKSPAHLLSCYFLIVECEKPSHGFFPLIYEYFTENPFCIFYKMRPLRFRCIPRSHIYIMQYFTKTVKLYFRGLLLSCVYPASLPKKTFKKAVVWGSAGFS